jgi:hypothetical protein
VSAGVHGLWTLPAQREVAQIDAQAAALRAQRQHMRARLAGLERREAARRRVAESLPAEAAARGDAPAALRRSVLRSLEGVPVSGVRLEVRPSRPPLAATVHLSAEGSTAEVVRLTGRLAQPGTGVVLAQVRLAPSARGAVLDLEGAMPGPTP